MASYQYNTLTSTYVTDDNDSFSTGICDLFIDPRHRTDCCAVAFCGVLVHDRNRHAAAYQQPPPPWWRRILVHIVIPMVGIMIVRDCLHRMQQLEWNATCRAAFPNDGSGPFLNVWNATHNSTSLLSDDESDSMEHLAKSMWGFGAATLLWVMVLLVRAARHRLQFRKFLLETLKTGPRSSVQSNFQYKPTDKQHRAASGIVGWYSIAAAERRALSHAQRSSSADLCSCLFGCLAHLFCSWGCNCWCQCCGMCAAAQEEREILARHDDDSSKNMSKMDYITFQPFTEYGEGMDDLRASNDRTWRSHFAAQSRLAKYLWRLWFAGLGIMATLALVPPIRFTTDQFLVVLATFAQAFVVLYLVYWWKHRMDVSLDTVVKCFAVGFLVSTQLAMASETVVSALIEVIAQFIFIAEHRTDLVRWFLAILLPAGQAFIVAAMSEELTKYFGFWMVETPDTVTTENRPHRSSEAVAAGITASMVATATGFACCENLEYVFAAGGDARSEINTLLLRSLFPVHPLAAAIQSIGVCRRDVEGNKLFSLGRVLLPAVLVHGFFDFFLMVAPVIQKLVSKGEKAEQNADSLLNATTYNAYISACNETIDSEVWAPLDIPTEATPEDKVANLVSGWTMCLSVFTVLVGIVFYVVEAKKQRARLKGGQQGAPKETSPLIS